jgi:hypothetical protein
MKDGGSTALCMTMRCTCTFRERLDELDADVEERCNVWVEQARSQLEGHEVRSKEELEAFYAVIRHVDADIVFLEVQHFAVTTFLYERTFQDAYILPCTMRIILNCLRRRTRLHAYHLHIVVIASSVSSILLRNDST